MPDTLFLDTTPDFSFRNTIYSHGWCELPPFEIDDLNWTLSYVFAGDKGGKPVSGKMSSENGRVKIELSGGKINSDRILREARHILRLDDDLNKFYKLLRKEKSLAWIAKIKAGRMLRSPTVFEDLVKTICTTNCSWSLTMKMVTNLVEKLGEQAKDGRRAFPTAEAMASQPAGFYRDEIRAGYRSEYLAELAERVASGEPDPEKWLNSDLPTNELKKEMKNVKGVGDYAAENLMKLVGRYDGLALDSWLRSQFYKKHNSDAVCEDKLINEFYQKYGDWRGLAIWCEMTERWLDGRGEAEKRGIGK